MGYIMTNIYTDNFAIERAGADDVIEFARILRVIWEGMEHQEWFAIDGEEYISNILTTTAGIGYKAVDTSTGKTAGLFMVALPGISQDNLGHDLGFSKEQIMVTAVMDSAAILPEYRGHHLQYRLMQTAEAELRKRGYRYLTSTVHPENHSSHNTLTRQGYRVVATKEKYGGLIRDILLKELN